MAKVLQGLIPIVEHSVSCYIGILVGFVVGWFWAELFLVHLSMGYKIDLPLASYWPILKMKPEPLISILNMLGK